MDILGVVVSLVAVASTAVPLTWFYAKLQGTVEELKKSVTSIYAMIKRRSNMVDDILDDIHATHEKHSADISELKGRVGMLEKILDSFDKNNFTR